MDLRAATWADIPRILDMTEDLVAAIDGPQTVDRCHSGVVVASVIQNPDGFAMVTRGGFLVAMPMASVINPAPMAMEMGWYARDGSGLHLLRAFENWADETKASLKVITTLGRDMTRLGYRLKEEVWVK